MLKGTNTMTKSRRLMVLRLQADHLLALLKDIAAGRALLMGDLPEDATVVGMERLDWTYSYSAAQHNTMMLVLHSESFLVVPDGQLIPEFNLRASLVRRDN